MIEKLKKILFQIKFEIEWGKAKKEGVIINEEDFFNFYCSPNSDIRDW